MLGRTCLTLFFLFVFARQGIADYPANVSPSAAVEARFKNHWPTAWEDEFQHRAQAVLQAQCVQQKAQGLGGRTYFENEKRAYGYLMAHLLSGDRETAIKELQREDAQAQSWHRHTEGIDLYACFTLKHQLRKYFLFGELLAPEYRQRMFRAAKLWTAEDPLHRAHPLFEKAGDGWGPDVRNSWVDVRSTENLFLMRVTSVYLMAEETGNEATREKYKAILLRYAASLYRVGMGEWDSENYHGHSLGPLLNLYDFAKDPQVKTAAKACLDYLCAVGAVKYFRGAFNGPSNRDYNHAQPFGGSAACMLWLYFGDTPVFNRHYESDEVHVFTSAYRPPAAVVHLARKNFERPAELRSSKPAYAASTTGDWKSPPAYYETQFFGRTFQMGSLVGGTTAGKTAVNGFKISIWDEDKGALTLQCVPGPDPMFVGSAKYVDGKVVGENRIAQNRGIAVWLVEQGNAPWTWTLPDDISIESADETTFLRGDRTWVAIHPLNTEGFIVDETLSAKLASDDDGHGQWQEHLVLSSHGRGGRYCGLAIEIGEEPLYKDYDQFKSEVLLKSKADSSHIGDGVAGCVAADGSSVRLHFHEGVAQVGVWRNGVQDDRTRYAKRAFVSVDPANVQMEQDWLGGELTIRAGGARFVCAVSESGVASYSNEE